MSWIEEISYEASSGELRKLYDRVKGPDNYIDNILKVHSLRPHTLHGHMTLYKNVLHNSNNTMEKWQLETIGVYVSYLNNCHYCIQHHFARLRKLFKDDIKADLLFDCIVQNNLEVMFDEKMQEVLHYANKLTLDCRAVSKYDVGRLQKLGFTDGDILEINQVISYFNYANRTVMGLGVSVDGDILGLSPSDSNVAENWNN
ncbi:MAG TPA: peroxidase-related enzyme [Flavobacteriales bacterium]|nr:peroxidase-related enzyme [Flavobacteriales bacterium]